MTWADHRPADHTSANHDEQEVHAALRRAFAVPVPAPTLAAGEAAVRRLAEQAPGSGVVVPLRSTARRRVAAAVVAAVFVVSSGVAAAGGGNPLSGVGRVFRFVVPSDVVDEDPSSSDRSGASDTAPVTTSPASVPDRDRDPVGELEGPEADDDAPAQLDDHDEHDVDEYDEVDEHDVDEHDVDEHDVDEHDVDEHDVDEHDVDEHDVDEHDVDEYDDEVDDIDPDEAGATAPAVVDGLEGDSDDGDSTEDAGGEPVSSTESASEEPDEDD